MLSKSTRAGALHRHPHRKSLGHPFRF